MVTCFKKVGVFAFFLLIWFFPLINYFEKYMLVFIACNIASNICQIFIKNRYLAFFVSVSTMIPIVLYQSEYLFFVVCPFFISSEYIQIFRRKVTNKKEKKAEKLYLGANASILGGLAVLLYSFFGFTTHTENNTFIYNKSQTVIWVMLFLCFMLAAICLSKEMPWKQMSAKYGICMEALKELRFIHLANVVCFIETMILFYFTSVQGVEYTDRIFFLPWLVHFGLMIYFNDPIFICLLDKGEAIFKKIVEKVK